MTVAEAIELLKTFPQDAPFIHTMYSDYEEIDKDDFSILEGERGKLIRRHGHLMTARKEWFAPDETPEYITAVHLRGN